MSLKESLIIDENQQKRIEDITARYKQMYTNPDNCTPMFIMNVPVKNLPTEREQYHDPLLMLKSELEKLRTHLKIQDDFLPMVRVQLGSGQFASAFGCEYDVPENNYPRVSSHALQKTGDIYKLVKPSKEAGLLGKLKAFTEAYLENLPQGVHIQLSDIQSPINNAHLIRGNDIFLDFYDDPDAVDMLLDVITDYMIDMIFYLKDMISTDKEWFLDWGALWKGVARISNCSVHMIGPELYSKHVLPRDTRLLRAIGGGRIHFCGSSGKVLDEFFKIPVNTGLDFDPKLHDLWEVAERAPKHQTLMLRQDFSPGNSAGQRLLSGDWPRKRNIIICSNVKTLEEGKALLKKLRESVPQ